MSIIPVGCSARSLIKAIRVCFSVLGLLMFSGIAYAESINKLVYAEYYIDSIPGLGGGQLLTLDTTEQFNTAYIIDNIKAPELSKGVHTLAIRFQNEDGDWSAAIQQSFYWPGYQGPIGQKSHLNPLIKGEVFLNDNEMLSGTGVEVAIAADGYVDTSIERLQRIAGIQHLKPGKHTVSLKLLDSSGIWSAPLSQSFYIYGNNIDENEEPNLPSTPDNTYEGNNNNEGWFFPSRLNHFHKAVAYYDNNSNNFVDIPLPTDEQLDSGSALFYFDFSTRAGELSTGIHNIQLSLQDSTGQWSQPVSQSILINPTHKVSVGQLENRIVAARYSIDDQTTHNLTAQDGTFDDALEVVDHQQAVSNSFHNVEVNFLDLSGQWTDPANNITVHIENDSDGNNIPDAWEFTWFGQVGVDPSDDADGDGISNLEEFQQGKHPLVDETQTALTISGYVKDAQGNSVPHVLVCINDDDNCPVRTDSYGHYTLGLSQVLTANDYQVYVRSTSASGLKAFSPAKTISLNDTSIDRVNFTTQDIQLTWTFSANNTYQVDEVIELQWQSNVASNTGVVIELRRDTSLDFQTDPDETDSNINWYRFPTIINSEGIANITIPEGLSDADDWRLSLMLEGSEQPKLVSAPFTIDSLIEPEVEIELTSLDQPMAGEFITAKAINTDITQTLVQYQWSAMQLNAGVETGERIILGNTDTLRTELLNSGDWQLSLQGQNEQGIWSAKANKEIFVTAIEGLADLAINQTSIKVLGADNQESFSVEQSEQLSVQVTVSNEGTVDLPDTATIIVKNQTATLATIEIAELAAGSETSLAIPVTAPSNLGYQPLTVEIQFTQNIAAAPEQLIVAESNRFNNAASFFIVVGNPPTSSNFAIDLTIPEVITSYPGQTPLIYGNAKYDFASRLPVMGSKVTVALNGETKYGRTTSPAGDFSVRVKAPSEIGDHQVEVIVQGGNYLQVTKNITLRVIPWPDPVEWSNNVGTYQPIIPTPVKDLIVKRVTLTGDGVFRTDNNALAVVQQTDLSVNAQVHNNRELSVDTGFTLAFYYVDASQGISETSTKYYIGEPVVVNQSLAPEQTISVISPLQLSFNNLGNKRIYAEVVNVANEDITTNNINSINVDVRSNYPDLRGSASSHSIVFSNTAPIPNETIRIVANIVNRGPADLHDSFTVNFYQGSPSTGEFIGSSTYNGGLEKWQSVSADVEWTATELGTQHIYAVIDENNHIDEDSETNNTLSGSVTVIADEARLKLSLGLSEYSVTQSSVITLNSAISNYGTQPSEASLVRFYWGEPSDNQVIDTIALNSIAKKDNVQVSIDWSTIIPHGKQNVCAVVINTNHTENLSNTACTTLQITDLPVPDLRIYSEYITYQPDVPEIGNQVSVSAVVQNVSQYRSAQNVTVQFYVDSDRGLEALGDAITIDSISASGSINVSANASFTVNQPAYVLLVRVLPSAIDGDANLADNEATTAFSVAGFPEKIIDGDFSIPLPSKDDIQVLDGTMDNGTTEDVYEYTVTLQNELPVGYGLFLNFDDQKGEWFVQNTPGGHLAMEHQGGGEYKLVYQMQKPGLRSFRVGVFSLENGEDLTDDRQIGEYSDYNTCTLDSCQQHLYSLIEKGDYGNPALSQSGSQLINNVDVASGNFHLMMTDMATQNKGINFALTRAYNTRGNYTGANGWTFAHDTKINFIQGTYNRQLSMGPREDGRTQHYFKDMDNLWYALDPGNFSQLIEEPNGSFTLYSKGNRVYKFNQPVGEAQEEVATLNAIVDRLGNGLHFSYGIQTVTITDEHNRSVIIDKDSSGRTKRVTDYEDRYVEYTYDDNGSLTNLRNMRGETSSYDYQSYSNEDSEIAYRLNSFIDNRQNKQFTLTYNNANRVTKLSNGLNEVTNFIYISGNETQPNTTTVVRPSVYDAHAQPVENITVYILDNNRRRITQRIDAKDSGDYQSEQKHEAFTVRNRLAEQSLVNKRIDAKGQENSVVYSGDGKGNAELYIDAEQRETAVAYMASSDNANQINLTPVTSVQKPYETEEPATTRYAQFTTTGKPQQIIDPRNNSTQLAYGFVNVGNNEWLTSSTNARNNTTNYEYDIFGNINKITDAKNNVVSKVHDDLGRVKTETSSLGLTTTYTYDEHGNIKTKNVKATNYGIDYTTQYFYDANDNITYSIDAKGHRIDYEYDVLNRKTKESYKVNGELYTKRYSYDALGRISTVTNKRDYTSTTHYTARGQVQSKVNPLQETTVTYTYDANGNVETVTDAEGRTITTVYDALNRKTHVVDSEQNQQQWSYNAAGQVKQYTDARDSITKYQYDKNGNLVWLKDANNGVTESEYDANNNPTKVTGPNGSVTEYTYDELDRRTKTTIKHNDEAQIWQYSYDANGNLLTEVKPTGARIVKQYDPLNRVIQNTEYNDGNIIVRDITYTYDANSNVRSQSNEDGSITYEYDAINRITSVTDQFDQTIAYGYDKAGNRTELTYPGNKTIKYAFDDADRLESVTDWLNNTTDYIRNESGQTTQVNYANGSKVKYDFDTAGRLILLENLDANSGVISRHQLTLDGAGNITNAAVTLPLEPKLPTNFSATFDSSNRILTAGDRTFEHDQSGRIIEYTKASENQPALTTTYQFDINDQLTAISKNGEVVSRYGYDVNNNRISQQQLQAVENTETSYVIDQLANLPNVIAETNDNGAVKNYYIYGEGLVSKVNAAGDSHYYHYDPTGHTLALTNANGYVSDKYAYTPYGKTTQQGTTHNPFLFVGKHGVMDDSNGLHFMRARYYKEDIKRFISLDALHGEMLTPQSLNRYAYVLGNPIMGIDPSGLFCEKFLDPKKHNTKSLTGDITYADFSVDGCLDLSSEFFGGDFSYTSTLNVIDISTDQYKVNNNANGYGSSLKVSTDLTAGVEAYYKNDHKGQVEVKAGAGGCTNLKGEIGAELFGVRIKPALGGAAGACIGGEIKGYSDEIYTGGSLGGQAALELGLAVDLDVAINRVYWNEKKNKVTNASKIMRQTLYDSYYNFQQYSPFKGY